MQHRWDGGNMGKIDWNAVLNVSVDGIEFGTDRSVVRKILGKPKRVFSKTSDSVNTTDAYADFHAYYSADDKLEAIEVFAGNISLSINGKPVFPGTLSAVKEILPDLDGSCDSYVSKAGSVGICTEDDMIESILVGRKNYYR